MDNKNNKNNNFNNPIVAFAIFSLIMIALFKMFDDNGDISGYNNNINQIGRSHQRVSYSDIKMLIKDGKVDFVGIGDTGIKAISHKNGVEQIYTARRVVPDDTLIPLLEKKHIPYGGINEQNFLADLFFGWILPIFIFFGIWMFLANRMQKNISKGGGLLGIGSSKRMINSEKPKTKFKDMAGNEEAKEEVAEVVEFLKDPQRYIRLGAQIPKGVLLVGPPGTGKTLLAKAVAGEANVNFLSVVGSSFIEMFVGVGASRVRDLFEEAKKVAPAIIFIDEIDAIGKSRAAGGISGNDEREQTLNQLLSEMDGFGVEKAPVIVLAATNRPEVLDPALLRPGRFDRQVLVDKPDFEGRIEILKVHIKKVKLSQDIDIKEIARMTAGLAGADLANIVNEAALLAGRKNKKEIEQSDFKEAVERQIAGLEKKSRRISPKEKKIVAYHESGHALIAEITKGAKKVNKVSIIPRGLAALGYTLNTPQENKYLVQKHELIAEIDVLLGGRAAEEIFIGEISTGAANDLERATDIAKAMVGYYGMSDVAGLMVLEKQTNQFLGGGFTSKEYSEETAKKVDEYIKHILNQRYNAVLKALKEHKDAIEEMAKVLLESEVITGKDVRDIIIKNGGTVVEDEEDKNNQENKNNENKEDIKEEENINNEENNISKNQNQDTENSEDQK